MAQVIDIAESEKLPVPSSIEITSNVKDKNNPIVNANTIIVIIGDAIPLRKVIT